MPIQNPASSALPTTYRELRSEITADAELKSLGAVTAWHGGGKRMAAALGKMDMEKMVAFTQRVASELDTTFAST